MSDEFLARLRLALVQVNRVNVYNMKLNENLKERPLTIGEFFP